MHVSENPSRKQLNRSRTMQNEELVVPDQRTKQDAYTAIEDAEHNLYVNPVDRSNDGGQNQSKISSIAKHESFNKSMNSSSLETSRKGTATANGNLILPSSSYANGLPHAGVEEASQRS